MVDGSLLDARILVLGGSGFLGARIVRKLCNAGIIPHLLLRPSSCLTRIADLLNACEIHRGDLTDLDALRQTIERVQPDVLFFTAGHGAHKGHLVTTHHLLIASEQCPDCRIIYSGTSLFQGRQNSPMQELGAPDPVSFYGATKSAAVILMQQAAVHEQRPITLLMPFAIYGPGEPGARLIPTAIRAAIKDQILALTQTGLVRDYVFVDDVADAYLSAATTPKALGEIINIAGGAPVANEQVVALIEAQSGKTITKRIGSYPSRNTDSNFWCADISKAKKLLNWQPTHTLEQGLKLTIDWYRQNGFEV